MKSNRFRYKSHALSHIACSFINEYEERERYIFFYYKKRFFIEHSTIGDTHIYGYIYLFSQYQTRQLYKFFHVSNARELFKVVAYSCSNSKRPNRFGDNLDKLWDYIKISPDLIDIGSYHFNKMQLGYRQYILSRIREVTGNLHRDTKPSNLISERKRASSSIYDVCKWIDGFDAPEKITLLIFKKCLFFVKSTYYSDEIWNDIVGLTPKNTIKLAKLFDAKNTRELFEKFELEFYRPGMESKIWLGYMDYCSQNHIDYDRTNVTYTYNKDSISLTKFLLREFESSHTVNSQW